MAFNPGLSQGDVLNNEELNNLFQCPFMGGMRRSHKTNTLVIVSDHTKSLYDDKWIGDEFHYTGMGKKGHQLLLFAQNKTLSESTRNGVAVHWFEVFTPKQYVYQGEVSLVKKPYHESQLDEKKKKRDVWMFPLKLKTGSQYQFDEEDIKKVYQKRTRAAKKLSIDKIKEISESKKKNVSTKRQTNSTTYDRDVYVVEYALLRAKGICQLCDSPAPFKKKNGEPYLQVHHIEYLSNDGSDTYDNVVGLCPNCHAMVHTLENKKDVIKLKNLAQEKL